MDIDYSKFEIKTEDYPNLAKEFGLQKFILWEVSFGGFSIGAERHFTTHKKAENSAKRAIKRIVETAVGDK